MDPAAGFVAARWRADTHFGISVSERSNQRGNGDIRVDPRRSLGRWRHRVIGRSSRAFVCHSHDETPEVIDSAEGARHAIQFSAPREQA